MCATDVISPVVVRNTIILAKASFLQFRKCLIMSYSFFWPQILQYINNRICGVIIMLKSQHARLSRYCAVAVNMARYRAVRIAQQKRVCNKYIWGITLFLKMAHFYRSLSKILFYRKVTKSEHNFEKIKYICNNWIPPIAIMFL